ncbi:CHAP domain-containing protein [Agromyces luteolus]|nr:CHAP domain-containing protein [Agromyces luteolus]
MSTSSPRSVERTAPPAPVARRAPVPEAVAVPSATPADPAAIPAAGAAGPAPTGSSSVALAVAAATGGASSSLVARPAAGRRRGGASRTATATPAPSASGPVSRRNGPMRVAATVLLVPALVGTVALPAYAFLPGGHLPGGTPTKFSLSVAEAQALEVSDLAAGAPVSSDTFSVTTKEEIDAAAAEAERAAWEAELASRGTGEYAIVAQRAEGDDYPWWNQTPDDYGGGLSPLRYYYRECVDFVAWRLNRDAGVTGAPWKWDWGNLASGSAWMWADEWAAKGWPSSSEPVVGAVAWFPYNHVAYVQSVNGDGTVTIEEYNQNSDHSYHVRTIPVGEALYLYPPA